MSKIELAGITFKYSLTKAEFTASLQELSMDLELINSKNGNLHRSWDPKNTLKSTQPASTSSGFI